MFTQTIVQVDNARRYEVTLIGRVEVGDDNETDSTKVDRAQLVMPSAFAGKASIIPGRLVVEELTYNNTDFDRIVLYWDSDEDNEIASLPGGGATHQAAHGRLKYGDEGLIDPGSGGNGNIVLTTVGGVEGASYNIVLKLRKKA